MLSLSSLVIKQHSPNFAHFPLHFPSARPSSSPSLTHDGPSGRPSSLATLRAAQLCHLSGQLLPGRMSGQVKSISRLASGRLRPSNTPFSGPSPSSGFAFSPAYPCSSSSSSLSEDPDRDPVEHARRGRSRAASRGSWDITFFFFPGDILSGSGHQGFPS